MKPLTLFVITSDPRASPRVVEGIRIAVGIAAWKRVEVAVYLGGPAALVVAESIDDLVESENLGTYIPLLADLGRPVYLDAESTPHLSEAAVPIEAISKEGLGALAARSRCLLRF